MNSDDDVRQKTGSTHGMGVAFGNFYHDGCVPSLEKGPMPCGQYIGGIENYVV